MAGDLRLNSAASLLTVRCSNAEGGQLLPGSVIRHYRRGHLVLPGRCLALPGFLFWSRFLFFVVPKSPRFSNSNFWKKTNSHLEMLPGPTPVFVTCLPGPPSAQMRRLPLPWLSEDTVPNGSAAGATGEPTSKLNQLQPGRCTQLYHLNEAMPFRTAGRASSSWSHRRASAYLRIQRTHMSPECVYKHLSLPE